MGWLSWFSSAPKAVDNILDKDKGLITQFGNWVGNGNFTPEEVAELNYQTAQDVRKFVVDTLSESTDRSRTRREIAVFFIKFYALMLFAGGMVYPIDPTWSTVWVGMATSLSVGGLVSAISIFFFGSHAWAKKKEADKQA
jgi:hypothetical protein